MNTMHTAVLKEPLGFIRVIEFPMAILAFATTAGYWTRTVINVVCSGTQKSHEFSWGYSFALDKVAIPDNLCTQAGDPHFMFSSGAVSQSQFFVFTGVVCFFYILAILGIYLFAWSKYENDGRFPLGDFVATAILAFFWFVSSCAWASGVNNVKSVTDSGEILSKLQSPYGPFPCKINTTSTPAPSTLAPVNPCSIGNSWNYASLNVSLIAGFACFGLWMANLWFIYKETPWYKSRMAMTTTAPTTGPGIGTSAGPTPTGANTFR